MKPFVFAGTPAFAAHILQQLLAAGRRPVAVLTQPDRSHGRGRRQTYGPVKTLALAHELPLQQPASLKTDAAFAALAALQPRLLIVAAYGLLLPPRVLLLPSADGRGAVNVHASLLPRWRGAAPVERAIMAGDSHTGVCLMQMEASLDTGPVFASRTLPIQPGDTGGSLEAALAAAGAQLLCAHLDALLAGQLQPQPQAATSVTYAHKLTAADSVVDFRKPALQLANEIRALCDRKPLTGRLDGEPVRLLDGQPTAEPPPARAACGELLALDRKSFTVACGAASALRITRVQLTRGKGTAVPVASVRNGYPDLLRVGIRFELPAAPAA